MSRNHVTYILRIPSPQQFKPVFRTVRIRYHIRIPLIFSLATILSKSSNSIRVSFFLGKSEKIIWRNQTSKISRQCINKRSISRNNKLIRIAWNWNCYVNFAYKSNRINISIDQYKHSRVMVCTYLKARWAAQTKAARVGYALRLNCQAASRETGYWYVIKNLSKKASGKPRKRGKNSYRAGRHTETGGRPSRYFRSAW